MSAVTEVNVPTILLQIEAMNTWAIFLSFGIAQTEFKLEFYLMMIKI